jgi:TP901 family phage tail tape measure protein
MAAAGKEYKLAVKIAGSVSSSFNNAMGTAETKMQSLGSIAAKAAAVAAAAWGALKIGQFVGDAVNTYADFDQAMANTAAICGATADDYARLQQAALDMGKATTKTATESAEALGYMGLAGWDVNESIAGLEPILRLSEATQMDLATCSDLVTDSLSALGLQVDDLGEYLDVAAMANNKSNQTAQMLMEAYIAVGGTMKNLNVPIQESAAALGVLANRGIKGSEAGTALNAVINNLTTGTGQAGKMMDKLGISAFDSNGKFIGLAETIRVVDEATKGMTEEQRNAALAALGGKEHIDALNDLISGLNTTTADGRSEWEALTDDLYNADGALSTMAATVTDTLQGAISIFGSAMDDMKIRLAQTFAPAAKDAINAVSAVIPSITDRIAAAGNAFVEYALPKAEAFAQNCVPALEKVGGAFAAVGAVIVDHKGLFDSLGSLAITTINLIAEGIDDLVDHHQEDNDRFLKGIVADHHIAKAHKDREAAGDETQPEIVTEGVLLPGIRDLERTDPEVRRHEHVLSEGRKGEGKHPARVLASKLDHRDGEHHGRKGVEEASDHIPDNVLLLRHRGSVTDNEASKSMRHFRTVTHFRIPSLRRKMRIR